MMKFNEITVRGADDEQPSMKATESSKHPMAVLVEAFDIDKVMSFDTDDVSTMGSTMGSTISTMQGSFFTQETTFTSLVQDGVDLLLQDHDLPGVRSFVKETALPSVSIFRKNVDRVADLALDAMNIMPLGGGGDGGDGDDDSLWSDEEEQEQDQEDVATMAAEDQSYIYITNKLWKEKRGKIAGSTLKHYKDRDNEKKSNPMPKQEDEELANTECMEGIEISELPEFQHIKKMLSSSSRRHTEQISSSSRRRGQPQKLSKPLSGFKQRSHERKRTKYLKDAPPSDRTRDHNHPTKKSQEQPEKLKNSNHDDGKNNLCGQDPSTTEKDETAMVKEDSRLSNHSSKKALEQPKNLKDPKESIIKKPKKEPYDDGKTKSICQDPPPTEKGKTAVGRNEATSPNHSNKKTPAQPENLKDPNHDSFMVRIISSPSPTKTGKKDLEKNEAMSSIHSNKKTHEQTERLNDSTRDPKKGPKKDPKHDDVKAMSIDGDTLSSDKGKTMKKKESRSSIKKALRFAFTRKRTATPVKSSRTEDSKNRSSRISEKNSAIARSGAANPVDSRNDVESAPEARNDIDEGRSRNEEDAGTDAETDIRTITKVIRSCTYDEKRKLVELLSAAMEEEIVDSAGV